MTRLSRLTLRRHLLRFHCLWFLCLWFLRPSPRTRYACLLLLLSLSSAAANTPSYVHRAEHQRLLRMTSTMPAATPLADSAPVQADNPSNGQDNGLEDNGLEDNGLDNGQNNSLDNSLDGLAEALDDAASAEEDTAETAPLADNPLNFMPEDDEARRLAALQQVPPALPQESLEAFLARVADNAAVQASQAAFRAAAAELSGSRDVVQLESSLAYLRFRSSDDPDVSLPPEFQPIFDNIFPESPDDAFSASLTLRFRPFPFGDTRDLRDANSIALLRAELSLRQTLAQLETQALEAAYSTMLAREGVLLAQEALSLAHNALDITRLRFSRGAATRAELRQAEISLQEAQGAVRSAQEGLALAQLSLQQLVGTVVVPLLPALPIVDAEPALSVARAELDLQQASIGVRRAEREFLPVAQATLNLEPSDDSTLSLSLESRTLQPAISYSYNSASGGGMGPSTAFQIGISASISPSDFSAAQVAREQRLAAEAALRSSREQARVQQQRNHNAISSAERELALAESRRLAAQQNFMEQSRREELGLATVFTRQQAFLQLLQAEQSLRAAELALLQSILETYRFFGVTLSEVI